GEEGNVGDLVGGLVTLYLLDHLVAGIDEPVDAHPGLIRLGNAPAALADALERTTVGLFHRSVPKSVPVGQRKRRRIEDGGWKMAEGGSRDRRDPPSSIFHPPLGNVPLSPRTVHEAPQLARVLVLQCRREPLRTHIVVAREHGKSLD